jgi:hypothetical protein
MPSYTPITELDAVNLCLEQIGEQPVNTIPTSGLSDAVVAQNVVHRVSRRVQGMGLHCNTDEDYPLVPDINGNIAIPVNALSVDPSDASQDYTWRAGKLYDRRNQTSVFTQTVKVDIIWFFPFGDLPDHVRDYVAVVAAQEFQKHVVGSESLMGMSQEDVARIRTEFMRKEVFDTDATMLDSPGVWETVIRRI